jgi:hypothetical protein
MTSVQLHTTMNSKPTLSGNFAIVNLLDELISEYEDITKEALYETVDAETEHLRSNMEAHPDWAPLAENALVALTPSGLEYKVSGDTTTSDLLEFGDPTKGIAATGLLRSTAFQRTQEVSKQFSERLRNLLSAT